MLHQVSHAEYAPRALLKLLKDGTDRRTDGRQTDRYITLTARRGQRNKYNLSKARTDRTKYAAQCTSSIDRTQTRTE